MRYKIKRNKFNASKTEVDGFKFDSKKEARYYSELKLRVRSGEVLFFLRQVPLHLSGNTRYVCDFVEFHTDETIHFIDVKGRETDMFKMKKRQVEDLYPIEIEVV